MHREDTPGTVGVPLFTVRPGTKGRIGRIGGKEELRRHLFDLGFTIGESLTVMHGSSGDLIVDIRERIIEDGVSNTLLSIQHQVVYETSYLDVVELGIRK